MGGESSNLRGAVSALDIVTLTSGADSESGSRTEREGRAA